MPASSIVAYFPESRNHFNAVSPSLLTKANKPVGQCQNIHVSTNCYYGYHGHNTTENVQYYNTDAEMLETPCANGTETLQAPSRKRSADNSDYPQSKRIREEVQRVKNIEPKTKENTKVNVNTEYLLETLYWNIHGGNIYHLESLCAYDGHL